MHEFLVFLATNDFEKRVFTLPEGADGPDLDDAAKEYFSDLAELENQEYYVLNGFESEGELGNELKRLYERFRIYVFENKIKEQPEFSNEIISKLQSLLTAINEEIRVASALKSGRLEALYNKKLSYCQDALKFMKSKLTDEPGQIHLGVYYTYEWLKDPDILISKAYHLMVGKWISEKTTPEQFRNIFSKKPIGECQPIRWYEDAINGLVFFIMRMKERGIISDGKTKKESNHILMKTCFLKRSGEPFHQKNPKTTKGNINRDIAPAKKDAIDDLIHKIIS